MPRNGRYGVLLATFAGLLAFGAMYSIATLFGAVVAKPLASREGSDAFLVRDAQAIRPPASAYDRFARADAAWRAANAAPVSWESLAAGEVAPPPYVWHPSARQLATDSAYELVKTGRAADAIPILQRWVGGHPSDVDVLLDLARLENSRGNVDAAIGWYRQALALRPLAGARAELAAALLDGQRYDQAGREYRRLVALDGTNPSYRWGLARALAWGDRPRDAEPELRWLLSRSPGDTAAATLLRSVRASFDPTVGEAREWLAEAPGYRPYRVAYAQALARSGQYALAAAEYDSLLATGTSLALLREAAGVHGLARDSLGAARLLGRAVALAPADDSLRAEYAKALAWSGDSPAAIREYSLLIARRATPALLLARGELEAWAGDYAHAAPDLRTAVARAPSYEGYALLGDVYRWTGNMAQARAMYERAIALRPDDSRVLLALADLDRTQRLYGAAPGAGEPGWTLSSDYAEDNTGFLFLSAGVTRGFALGSGTIISVGADQRRIAQRFISRPAEYVYGYEANVGATQQLPRGFAAHATAGVARHAMVGDIALGSLGASWTRGRIAGSVEVSRGPVYQSLMSLPAIAPAARGGFVADPTRALVGRAMSATVTAPVERATVTVTAERMLLSDGNRRTSVGVSARLPITANVAALYDGGMLGYAQSSGEYWDPSRYTQQMVGVEVAVHPAKDLSISVRALPGIARSVESLPAAESTGVRVALPGRTVPQFATSGDLAWRAAPGVQVDAGLGYGRGREGTYQSMNGTLRVRLNW